MIQNAKSQKLKSHSILTMKKNQIYNEVKKLVIDLGGDLKAVKSKYKNKSYDKAYWIKQLKVNKKKVKTRNANYNRAIKLAYDLNEPVSNKAKEGTPATLWIKEIRRIRMRRRRIMKSINQVNSKTSIQKLLDKFKINQERSNNFLRTNSQRRQIYWGFII